MNAPFGRSLPELFTDTINQMTTLFRKEAQLARTEMSEKVGQAIGGLVMIVAGAVLLIPALVVLLGAAVDALAETGMEVYWAALIVGGGALLIGIILALVGVNRLKVENLAPNRTMHQLQRDAAVARDQVSSSHVEASMATRGSIDDRVSEQVR